MASANNMECSSFKTDSTFCTKLIYSSIFFSKKTTTTTTRSISNPFNEKNTKSPRCTQSKNHKSYLFNFIIIKVYSFNFHFKVLYMKLYIQNKGSLLIAFIPFHYMYFCRSLSAMKYQFFFFSGH